MMNARPVKQAVRSALRVGLRGLSRPLGMPLVRPWWVVIDITDRCFFRCPTCAKWHAAPRREELGTDDWRRVLDRLGGWLGRFHLSFTGGEPLLRQDLPDLIAWAKQSGATTNLMTNGYLVDEALVARLIVAGLDSVSISLNGLAAGTHDRSRGVPGSFDRAVNALALFKESGKVQVSVSAVLSGDNAEEIASLVTWARSKGIDGVGIQPQVPAFAFQPHDEALPSDSFASQGVDLSPEDRAAVDRSIGRLIAMKREGYPIVSSERLLNATRRYFQRSDEKSFSGCLAGFDNVLVDPYGEVRICNLMEPLGNAREADPGELWYSPRARQQRRVSGRCRKPCRLLICNVEDSLVARAGRFVRRLRAVQEARDGDR